MNIYDIIDFYEKIIQKLRKKLVNKEDYYLLDNYVNYAYKIAKTTKKLAMNKTFIKQGYISKYLVLKDNNYVLSEYGINLAITCSLFHNIGDIIQIVYKNNKDNGLIALEYLMSRNLLKFLTVEDQLVIYEVIFNNNKDINYFIDDCTKFYFELIKESKEINTNYLVIKKDR